MCAVINILMQFLFIAKCLKNYDGKKVVIFIQEISGYHFGTGAKCLNYFASIETEHIIVLNKQSKYLQNILKTFQRARCTLNDLLYKLGIFLELLTNKISKRLSLKLYLFANPLFCKTSAFKYT